MGPWNPTLRKPRKVGHPADCAFGGSPEKSLNLDEGVNHIVEGLETDCPPQISPPEIQAAPLPQGEKGLTFETKGEIIILIERIAVLSAHVTFFSPFSRIYSSFIREVTLRIRNP